MDKKVELPLQLKIENFYLTAGSLFAKLVMPIFIYNISKTVRDKRIINFPKTIMILNPLTGESCADILNNALWQYGIPTHTSYLQFIIEENQIYLQCNFCVPSTQYFYADVLIRQWEKIMGYQVISGVVFKDGIGSNKYSNKQYKPVGVHAKNKSLDMMIGMALFGNTLYKQKVEWSKDKEEVKFKIDSTNHEIDDIMGKPKSVRNIKNNQRSRSAKLGKTYK